MTDNKTCPHCGKPVPPSAMGDLCPECMLKAGLATQTEGPSATGEAAGPRFIPPPVGEIARLFPQLEILRLIGQGGMGAVYKARQPSLDRFVALKVLPPAAAGDPGFAERFNREARALARLNHPNIVAVHDFGKAGTLHYLVMEFVDGANLREVERLGELTPDQALAIVPQICEALQFAHNEGIVHRDIKPENLLLDKRGRVKITDFGIAKMVGLGLGQQNLTGAKDVVGTPHYMAPEQIEKPLSVDHRADIYSLGVVFYEMLTGELPLGKFQPPSSKVQIDVRLDEVVLHALEKEPNRRYQQASQVKSAVETIVTTPPGDSPASQIEPVTTATQIEAVRQRLKMPARGLIAAAVLQILFALGLLVFALPAVVHEGGGLAGIAAVGFGAAALTCFATLILLGAASMMKLRKHSFCVVASVVATVAGPGALLGLPFGVWAVIILNLREVREVFEAVRQIEDKKVRPSSETQNQRSPVARAFRHGMNVAFYVFLLVAGAALIITLLLPKDYVATATVRLEGPEQVDPYHLQTEAEIIQSQPVLEPVAASLNLGQRWGHKLAGGAALSDDQTVVLMKQRVEVRPIRNTALIQIRFYSDSPKEAAEIANKITDTYCALPPPVRANIIERALVPSYPVRPNVPKNIVLGIIVGGFLGFFVGIWAGLISFWRSHAAQRETKPSAIDTSQPGNNLTCNRPARFGAAWKLAAFIFVLLVSYESSRMVFSHLIAPHSRSTKSDDSGKDLLQRNVTYSARQASVQDIVQNLAEQAGLKYDWQKSFDQTDPLCRQWVRNVNIEGETCQQALDQILKPVGLRYQVEGDVLVLSRQDEGTARFDYIGQTWFPHGDSIEITSVERTPDQMTVKGHYNLVSHDHALLALYITTTESSRSRGDEAQTQKVETRQRLLTSSPTNDRNEMHITKGNGEFTLIHSHLVPGLPHVSMYANGHPFASLYFGTRAEALEESKAGWITNASSASGLQFRLVLPNDSTTPADWLPSASGPNRLRVSRDILLDDSAIARAGVDFDASGRRMIEIRFTDAGAKDFEAITATNIGHQLAILFRGRVLSAPVIQSVIPGGECQVTGSMSAEEIYEIVDCLNRTTPPSAEAWDFSPVHERVLPFKPYPNGWYGWLDLDSGVIITNTSLDWITRAGHDWIQDHSLDVVPAESARQVPGLIAVDMITSPAPTNAWDIVTAADVVQNWDYLRDEQRQMKVLAAMPGQSDTFFFQTREGGKGILQLLGLADNPAGVKIRYKLVQDGGTTANPMRSDLPAGNP